jgi:poly-gamma-glutamate synthesis protein (capsule biosynthesis protein)
VSQPGKHFAPAPAPAPTPTPTPAPQAGRRFATESPYAPGSATAPKPRAKRPRQAASAAPKPYARRRRAKGRLRTAAEQGGFAAQLNGLIVCVVAALLVGIGGAVFAPSAPLATFAQVTAAAETPIVTEESYTRVTFSAVGDNLMHMPVVNEADSYAGTTGDGLYDFTPMYAGVADIIASHDLNFIDIETILGGDYLGLSGYPAFNSPAAVAYNIASFGWNLATTATNHALDMGIEGINNSCATWSAYDSVTVTGTFASREDRATIRLVEKNGITFAFLAYTDYLNDIPVPSGYEYAVATADADAMAADVARARELGADAIIVAMSWGSEYSFTPNDSQRWYAQFLANLGVDLVVGFGPHVIEPIEWYYGYDDAGNPTGDQTLVVFSLGNFLSNQPYPYANVEGCFTCTFERLGTSGEVTLTDLTWIPLVNHISNGNTYHRVYQLKDYTSELAWSHDNLSEAGDPLAYAYQLTWDVIGPSGVTIDA